MSKITFKLKLIYNLINSNKNLEHKLENHLLELNTYHIIVWYGQLQFGQSISEFSQSYVNQEFKLVNSIEISNRLTDHTPASMRVPKFEVHMGSSEHTLPRLTGHQIGWSTMYQLEQLITSSMSMTLNLTDHQRVWSVMD